MASQNKLASLGLRLSDWFERWFPDAFSLALAAVAIVFIACLVIGSPIVQTAQWFGAGFWDLVAFTMQMSMIIVTGYALATTRPVYGVIRRLAAVPSHPRGAVAFVGLFSMLSSLLSWSFSLIFSALLAREVATRVRGADYRAIGAAAYLGVGSVWALGLSSSAALLMANAASLPQSLRNISGVIPIDQTLGLWQGMLIAAVLIFVSMSISYYSHPAEGHARTMADMGISQQPAMRIAVEPARKPGEWLEHSPMFTLLISAELRPGD
jgi:short-chain fatty acids transporter